jgi:hypothetical protein
MFLTLTLATLIASLSLSCAKHGTDTGGDDTPKTEVTGYRDVPAVDEQVNIYNPGRGFYVEVYVEAVNGGNPVGNLVQELNNYPEVETPLALSYIKFTSMPDYGVPLSAEQLNIIQGYFNKLQEMGMKAVLRFAYEFSSPATRGPTLPQVLAHMEQLGPIIEKNKHLILTLEAGFIGAWGEWHSSVNGLDSDANRKTILTKLMQTVPEDMVVQVRLPNYKNLISHMPEYYSRIGNHDDMIAIEPSMGDGGLHQGTAQYNQLVRESPYVMVGGELPVGPWSLHEYGNDEGWLIDGLGCARMFFLQHYTFLSILHNYKDGAGKYSMKYWQETKMPEEFLKRNGFYYSPYYFETHNQTATDRSVFDYIRDHLGYRIELQRVAFPETAKSGESFTFGVQLINRGYATVYGDYDVSLVLVDSEDNVTEFPLNADAHSWQPWKPNATTRTPIVHEVSGDISLSGIAPGTYDVGLWIADGAEQLKYDDRYAIQCANAEMINITSGEQRYKINKIGQMIIQ